eukprot:359014-Chlamydomonas_euryale.AAC.17
MSFVSVVLNFQLPAVSATSALAGYAPTRAVCNPNTRWLLLLLLLLPLLLRTSNILYVSPNRCAHGIHPPSQPACPPPARLPFVHPASQAHIAGTTSQYDIQHAPAAGPQALQAPERKGPDCGLALRKRGDKAGAATTAAVVKGGAGAIERDVCV